MWVDCPPRYESYATVSLSLSLYYLHIDISWIRRTIYMVTQVDLYFRVTTGESGDARSTLLHINHL